MNADIRYGSTAATLTYDPELDEIVQVGEPAPVITRVTADALSRTSDPHYVSVPVSGIKSSDKSPLAVWFASFLNALGHIALEKGATFEIESSDVLFDPVPYEDASEHLVDVPDQTDE